jgi:hypothetical protein
MRRRNIVADQPLTHDSPGYQEALKALGNAAKRDVRIVKRPLALPSSPQRVRRLS